MDALTIVITFIAGQISVLIGELIRDRISASRRSKDRREALECDTLVDISQATTDVRGYVFERYYEYLRGDATLGVWRAQVEPDRIRVAEISGRINRLVHLTRDDEIADMTRRYSTLANTPITHSSTRVEFEERMNRADQCYQELHEAIGSRLRQM